MRVSCLALVQVAFLALIAMPAIVFGQLAYGPGDKVFLSSSASTNVIQGSLTTLAAPTSGALSTGSNQLAFIPGVSNSNDRFVVAFQNDAGVTMQIEGVYSDGVLKKTLGFMDSPDGGQIFVEGRMEDDGDDKNILDFNTAGIANASIGDGLYVSIVSGTFARASFGDDFFSWNDWKDWLHDVGNAVFPGSATNESNESVLVWSDDTGYYYLPPGETSASGDCVDYIYNDGEWYKVEGIWVGHVDIGADGIPEVPHQSWGYPVGMPAVPGPTDLDPVEPGDWVPTDLYPIPVPHVCQMIDW